MVAMARSTAGLVLLLGALSALTPASIDMYLPSFPALGRALDASPAAVQLTLSAYLIGLGVGQALYGPLADRFGRRQPLAAGLSVYALASIGCALAPTIHALIALRFVQAIAGSACLVIPRAIVRDLFEPQESARIFSLLMLVVGVAPILAPVAGSQIASAAGWRAIFALLALLGIAGVAATLVALPETRPRSARSGGSGIADYGRVLSDRRALGFILGGGLAMGGLFAYISGSPFVLIEHYGLSARAYGLVFGSIAAGLIAASQWNRRLLARYPSRDILTVALVLNVVLGVGLVLVGSTGFGGLPALIVFLLLFISTLGLIQPNAIACALADHPERAASASALYGVVQFGVASAASALVGALHDDTPRSMTAVMAISGVGALAMYRWLVKPGPPRRL